MVKISLLATVLSLSTVGFVFAEDGGTRTLGTVDKAEVSDCQKSLDHCLAGVAKRSHCHKVFDACEARHMAKVKHQEKMHLDEEKTHNHDAH